MNLRLAAALVTALVATGGCAAPTQESPDATTSPNPASTTPAASTTPSPTASENPSPGTGSTLPADLRTRPEVAAAIADTAQRAQVDPEQVLVAAWSPVTWNDGSLGCPQKDMLYTQALVDGELLMLRVEQALFQYHSARGGPFTYCATPDASYTVTG